jgi:hypothetical protein
MRAFEPPTRSSPPFPFLTDHRAAVWSFALAVML